VLSGKKFKPVLKPRYQYWLLIMPLSFALITFFACLNYLILRIPIIKIIKIAVLCFAYSLIYWELPDLFPGFLAWLEQTEVISVLYQIMAIFPMGLYLIKLQESDINTWTKKAAMFT